MNIIQATPTSAQLLNTGAYRVNSKSDVRVTSILVADDHAVVLRGLRNLLETHPGWQVYEASNGDQALEMAKTLNPDVAILDISMPNTDGLEATSRILKIAPELPVLILTMQDDSRFIEEALKAGARGYVLKSDAEKDLLMAVEALLDKRTFFTSAASQAVLERFRRVKEKKERRSSTDGDLSLRDREIVQLLAAGKSNKEVAAKFHISVRTAEYHRTRIMRRLGLSSLSDLVRYAIRNKIIEP